MNNPNVKVLWLAARVAAKFSSDSITKSELKVHEKKQRLTITHMNTMDFAAIAAKRVHLTEFAAVELNEIFSLLWTVLGPFIQDDILSEEGYIVLRCNMELALIDEGFCLI